MKRIKYLFLLCIFSAVSYSQTVTLTVTGDGRTKDEAVKNALRSAIEQSFGTFISSNTEILNNELVKDEIVSISRGNIKSYKEIGSVQGANGQTIVTLSAVVSIETLSNYARSKGTSVEIAGNVFAANMKMRQLNTNNEKKVLEHLLDQIRLMATDLCTYKVAAREPTENENGGMNTSFVVYCRATKKMIDLCNFYDKTLKELAMSKEEIDDYTKANRTFYYYCNFLGEKPSDGYGRNYAFRSDFNLKSVYKEYKNILSNSIENFYLKDNIGNKEKYERSQGGKYEENFYKRIVPSSLQNSRIEPYKEGSIIATFYGGFSYTAAEAVKVNNVELIVGN